MKNIFIIIVLVLIFSASYAQKKLVITKIKNNHTYSFNEGKKIQCRSYDKNDSVFLSHNGVLTFINDSLIKIKNDTIALKDISSVKRYYSVESKIALSCLFLYLPFAYILPLPLAFGSYYWAISQGISHSTSYIIGFGVEYTGAYASNYYFLSNSAIFKVFNKIGTKYTLKIQK